VNDGRRGEDERAFGGREDDFGAAVHAGAEGFVGVGERGADVDGSGGSVDAGADGGDLGVEGAAGVGIDGELHRLAFAQAAELLLREREVDVDGVDAFEDDDGIALGEELAGVNLHDAEATGEGGGEVFLGDGDLELIDGGGGLGGGRFGGVEIGGRIGAAGAEFAGAVEVDFSELGLGFEAAQLGLFAGGVEDDEGITCGDDGAGLSDDVEDEPVELRFEGGALEAGEGAYGRERIGPGLLSDGRGADSGWGHDDGGVGGHLAPDGEDFVAENGAEDGQRDHCGEKQAFIHSWKGRSEIRRLRGE